MTTPPGRPITTKEWGVRWAGDDKITVYTDEKAAKGLFKHYGLPGEELVSRLTTDWAVEDEKKKD
jgi:hypothetical protein